MNADERHLRFLSIFHFVLGFLYASVASAILIVLLLIASLPVFVNDPDAPPAGAVQAVCVGYACLFVVPGWLAAACTVCAGICIAVRRWYTLCLAIAVLNCLCVPLGTVLGVMTIIVLVRPSVQALFGRRQSAT